VGVGAAGGPGGTNSGDGGAGGLALGGLGATAGSGGTIDAFDAEVDLTDTSIGSSVLGDGGSGGDGIGGTGGRSNAAGSTGGKGGSSGGGQPRGPSLGAAVRAGKLVVESSYIGGTSGGAGGRGGSAVGGNGGNATNQSAESPGGPGGSAAGRAGGAGGSGAMRGDVITMQNTTIDGSTSGAGGAGGSAIGGVGGLPSKGLVRGAAGPANGGKGGAAGTSGIWSTSSLVVQHVTVVDAPPPPGGAGGVATAGGAGGTATDGSDGPSGKGAFVATGSGSLTATLVVSSSPSACSGPIADGGFNLEVPHAGDAISCPATLAADPLLRVAGDFGGPTWTRPPDTTIPIDRIPVGPACLATDQRGVARPQGAACDVGAYERMAPGAATGTADGLGDTVASLHGTAVANGPAGTVHFEYGTTTAYGSQTPDVALPLGFDPSVASAALSGLLSGTTYHYRVVAATPDGTSAGEDATFTTTGASPPGGTGPGGTGSGSTGPDGPGSGSTDTTAPILSVATFRPKSFPVRRAGSRRGGGRLGWRLSEAATIAVAIEQSLPGRRSGARCVKPTAKLRRARRCTRYKVVGRFTVRGAAGGPGSRLFTGRFGKRRLRPGRYRAVLVATDAAGNRSLPRRVAFRLRG